MNNNFNFNENSKNGFNGNNKFQDLEHEKIISNTKRIDHNIDNKITDETPHINDRLVDLKV